jgi:nicotinate phosphoribosyltransferase
MSFLSKIYQTSLVLLTDLYQFTMAYGYWRSNLHEREAVFHYSFRKAPFQGGYALFCGLGTLIDYLQNFKFTQEDLEYLASVKDPSGHPLFNRDFLRYLKQLRFNCTVDAVSEGTVVFPNQPLIRIQGPLLQCQLLESCLLNIINFQTLVATNASRLRFAAQNEPIIEFGIRRAQGFDGALSASRASYIGGCTATSNVLAGKLFNIPVQGTQSHSWVMCFDSEIDAFKTYAAIFPTYCIFVVDTYDTLQGIKKAIEVAQLLKEQGFKLLGVRLDSGDLAYLSQQARTLLNEAGYPDALIIGSNHLNSQIISSLKQQGAAINTWGVGTQLVTAYEQPALEGVYKLSALRDGEGLWQEKIKLSEQAIKISTPGVLAIKRFYKNQGAIADAVYDIRFGITNTNHCMIVDPLDATRRRSLADADDATDLLQPIFKSGELIIQPPDLKKIQQHAQTSLQQFDPSIRRLLNPHVYPVGLEQQLYDLRMQLILKMKSNTRAW